MAIYIGPTGEVNAHQLTEDRGPGKAGEWWLEPSDIKVPVFTDVPLGNQVTVDEFFRANFKQKYPKPVGSDRIDIPAPTRGSAA